MTYYTVRLQGWLVVILVGQSAVLLTDAKSRNSHQEARLLLIRMWPEALVWLKLNKRSAPKKE